MKVTRELRLRCEPSTRRIDSSLTLLTLRRFTVRCLPAIIFFDPRDPSFTHEEVFKRSLLLYWAVITVGARESPNLKGLFTTAQANTIDLLRQTVAGPPVSYWDLCGAMVYNKWLSPIRPIGEDMRSARD
jgi:hypothetical protein